MDDALQSKDDFDCDARTRFRLTDETGIHHIVEIDYLASYGGRDTERKQQR